MKRYLLVVALAALPACGKQNDAHILQHEAETLVQYYLPKLNKVDERIQDIMKRGQTIPGDAPGVRDLGLRLQEARDTAIKLRGIIGTDDQSSPIKKEAEAAAKDKKIEDLEKLVHDTEVTFDRSLTVIDANLNTIEAWIAQYDSKTLAVVASAAPVQGEPPAPAPQEPGAPAAPAPTTGQPPAAQPGAPATDAKADAKAPAAPKADAKAPAAPKADAKAPAAQPKAAQPAPAQPKAPAPAPAQNK